MTGGTQVCDIISAILADVQANVDICRDRVGHIVERQSELCASIKNLIVLLVLRSELFKLVLIARAVHVTYTISALCPTRQSQDTGDRFLVRASTCVGSRCTEAGSSI